MAVQFTPVSEHDAAWGNPFTARGTWLRGNTHTHSTYSDGKLTVAQVADWYRDHGYDFLCITDHDVVAPLDEAAASDITMIPGAEIGVAWPQAMLAEVCAIGIEHVKRKFVHPQYVIDDVLDQGGIPVISHPHMSGVYSGLMMTLKDLAGIEIFNAGCQGSGRRGLSTTHWDDLLCTGMRVWGWASDDRHTSEDDPTSAGCQPGHDRGKAWVMVRATDRSQASILEAIRHGWFYSTTGPTIEDIQVDVNADEIRVRCSPAKQVTFASLPWTGMRIHAQPDEMLTDIVASLGGVAEPVRAQRTVEHAAMIGDNPQPKSAGCYFRVEIWDGEDGYAWSNPYWFGIASWSPGEVSPCLDEGNL